MTFKNNWSNNKSSVKTLSQFVSLFLYTPVSFKIICPIRQWSDPTVSNQLSYVCCYQRTFGNIIHVFQAFSCSLMSCKIFTII